MNKARKCKRDLKHCSDVKSKYCTSWEASKMLVATLSSSLLPFKWIGSLVADSRHLVCFCYSAEVQFFQLWHVADYNQSISLQNHNPHQIHTFLRFQIIPGLELPWRFRFRFHEEWVCSTSAILQVSPLLECLLLRFHEGKETGGFGSHKEPKK